MIATITTQNCQVSSMDSPLLRNSNLAGEPLPLIPRRSASTSRLPLPSFVSYPPVAASPVKIKVQGATPPDSDEKPVASSSKVEPDTSSSGSEGSSSILRPKRVLGVPRASLHQPPSPTLSLSRVKLSRRRSSSLSGGISDTEQPASSLRDTSISRAPIYTFGDKHLHLDDSKRHASESHLPDAGASSKSAPVNATPPMIVRNKSGQLIKSSLKSTKTPPRGSLSVFTGMTSSKSEPNTPSLSKAVHFDAQLEHVKLFLAEQKPLAVSRDGSPTDDTSGTDSDFPPFIFGEPYMSKHRLVMNVINMPPKVNHMADVAMDSLLLSADGMSITGRVRVRNLVFQKWLAVRFTFDAWQTTSEVTARYAESVDSSFDIFSFSIKLNDILARIEERTLVLALRYSVEGREIWDNNNGRNYVAKFSRVKPSSGRGKTSGSDSGSDIADLRKQLEKVVQKRGEEVPGSLPPLQPRSGSASLGGSSDFKKGSSLSSRYDFGTSLKTTWSPPTTIRHSRTHTYPTATTSSPPSSIPWPTKVASDNAKHNSPPVRTRSLGSPRDQDGDTFRPAPYVASDAEDAPFAAPTISRHHQRGYFDLDFLSDSALKRTPPGTPRMRSVDDLTPIASPSSGRCHSFPPVDALRPAPLFSVGGGSSFRSREAEFGAGSDESTPSIMSPTSSGSSSPTPSPTETEFTSLLNIRDDDISLNPNTNYHQFLNRFCFYTGPNSVFDTESDPLSRTSSMSSIEEILTVSAPPRVPMLTAQHVLDTPTQIQDGSTLSGSSTPTPFSFQRLPQSSVTL
ncbi:putative phosphatase regulatory subunit-domain-containing protein [Armillaria borealis]|uniref:Phosphatase regulatory subunit-domain-containing protein n=1 Tax=Armillaria borealis TaxID=47425 RepID=A0AA39JFB8_9AGAR|nr:putative phosphatase regulatory subunit-domain-containing protein [Armillaria borealis]